MIFVSLLKHKNVRVLKHYHIQHQNIKMHFVWSIMTLFWVKILSLEHHDAMKCDLKTTASYEHQPGIKSSGIFRNSRYSRMLNKDNNLNNNNVLDCHCITKTKVSKRRRILNLDT